MHHFAGPSAKDIYVRIKYPLTDDISEAELEKLDYEVLKELGIKCAFYVSRPVGICGSDCFICPQ